SSSNNISVNGLNFTIKGTTVGDEELSITINNDTQAVYDMIKGFVTSYNELLKEMNEAYYADHARGYDPLTDEEKEAMTDEQVEKWEKKIKDSLLRRDSNLYSVINALKTSMGQRVNVNGKNYSLTSFGITSPDYTEKGLLHINGDSESTLVGLKDNELMEALTEDPETVMQVFTELAGNLYNTMTDQMKSTSLSSALTFYNDKQMKNTLDDYKDELSRLEERLSKVEERYYKQFAAMERALSQANSQSSSILSLLGMNTGQ
ncbi:MAG: flagellar filament capping protein FliD, partial [Clostridiales bacterium]|nr:flagellar filament capping protein FliD [Clostridiales bacterium]